MKERAALTRKIHRLEMEVQRLSRQNQQLKSSSGDQTL